MTTRPSEIKRKPGTMNVAGTKKWDGTKWVPVNVARDGQKATRNGKPVIRKNGKWVPYTPPKRGYNPVQRNTPTKAKPTATRSNNAAAINARLKEQRAAREAAISRSRGGNNSHILRPAEPSSNQPKNDPPKPRRRVSPTASSPSTRQPTPRRAPQQQGEGGMDANYRAWAKANPTLAKKVKKGQSGYKAINSSSSTPRAAGPEHARDLRSGPTPPKRTSLKTTATKTTKPTKQKPLTVHDSKIPKDLTSAAGRKYLADLDAGKLTRKRK